MWIICRDPKILIFLAAFWKYFGAILNYRFLVPVCSGRSYSKQGRELTIKKKEDLTIQCIACVYFAPSTAEIRLRFSNNRCKGVIETFALGKSLKTCQLLPEKLKLDLTTCTYITT